ncbi:hypothetical protein ACKAV7_009918 [Fusarium commune]|uniref:Uncharacterized protein n=1 Tax=Fusarium oxysporum f. sp. rapae TaxID=485398 RepID=A0A8J5P470_FUSOX|nr:hypothetical protein Forpe1208_v009812 [Fusarium oxysporum f. sp. rapae]KAI7770651.1 hypothetical protein LZL87_003022 [Fusarium oxysporum]
MAEDEKTLAQKVEELEKQNLRQKMGYKEDLEAFERSANQERETLKRHVWELRENVERETRIAKAMVAKKDKEIGQLQEENRVLKEVLAGVESAMALLKTGSTSATPRAPRLYPLGLLRLGLSCNGNVDKW